MKKRKHFPEITILFAPFLQSAFDISLGKGVERNRDLVKMRVCYVAHVRCPARPMQH